jgi:hypothetical protein
MTNGKIFAWLIAPVIIIATCLAIFILLMLPPKHMCRKLRTEEIRPIVKRITGRELPVSAKNLRGILLRDYGEVIYLVFETDPEGFSYILATFGGQDVKRIDFPGEDNTPWDWDMSAFRTGVTFQEECGVLLFDVNLFDRIKRDAIKYMMTEVFPDDAVRAHHLESGDSWPEPYEILLFKDLGVVYLKAGKCSSPR